MCEIAVMFDEDEMALIQAHAVSSNTPFSEFVSSATLEKVEDMADVEAYGRAPDEGDGTRYSMDDVMCMAMKG